MHVGKIGAAGEEEENPVPAEADIAADVAVPIRVDHSLIVEFCVGGDE